MIPSRIYDLSQPVFSNCPQYPDDNPRPAQIRLFYMLAVQGVNKEIVEISTHTGTHVDAPFHFFEDGRTIDEVPLESYVGPAVVLDLREKEAGSSIERQDLEPLAGELAAGDIALLNTGGGHRRANTKAFLTEYVYLSGEGAQYLIDRGVKGVGIDAVSMGGYNDPSKSGPPHRILLGSGAFIIEELYFPEEVMDGRKRLFVAAPVKLRGCSGAWTRAALWEF
jgi:kynurenine formamidase